MPILVLSLVYLYRANTERKATEQTLSLPLYLSTGLLGVYLIFSVCATHDFLAWNRVRWQSLNQLIQQGVNPTKIDGGLEFNGWHLYNTAYKSTPDKSWWWVHDDTYAVGISVLPGYTLFRKYKVDTWLPWGIQQIIIGKKSQLGDETRLTNPYSTN